MKIAAAYSRVSTEDQGQRGTSLDTQEAAEVALAKSRDFGVPQQYRIREEYTGATLNRPGLDTLRTWVKVGKIQAVAYFTADRLSRDPIDLMILLREFRRAGVEILAVHYPPSDDPLGPVITFMQGTFADIERREFAERTMRGKRQIARKGRLPQGTGAGIFGYTYDPSGSTFLY